MSRMVVVAAVCVAAGLPQVATAQDLGTDTPKPLPPLAHPEDPATPAKQLFGRKTEPAAMPPRVYGFYARGCMSGAEALPITGDAWQVMRLSRNRNWGQPALIAFLERMARREKAAGVWPDLLVGDMAQPRGGPMLTGHASHQIGLDADLWLRPGPDRPMSRSLREYTMSTNVVREDRTDINPQAWTPQHMELLHDFAAQPEVQRIFVNPAIKKAICRDARGDRSWLSKIRPEYGHDYHFHVRLACPAGESACERQDPPPPGDGCDATLAHWFSDAVLHPKPNPNYKPKPPLTMAALPAACRQVLAAP